MKSFYHLLKENQGGFHSYEVYNAWLRIQSEIMSARSYIEAGHDVNHVLERVAKMARHHLEELDWYHQEEKQSEGGKRPLDEL